MAQIFSATGGTAANLVPSTGWTAPANMLLNVTRNDGASYSWNAATSTVTLPSSGLADGYLIIAAYEYHDTSNGRHCPQGRVIQASGTGNFTGSRTGGYSRSTAEDRAYVRCWAFVDNPSASSTFQLQYKRDGDAPGASDGSIRSAFEVVPFYYSNIGMYSNSTNSLYGGTTPNKVTGWSSTFESDTSAIELASDEITIKTPNRRYLVLSSQGYEGRGGRTQRWHGMRLNGAKLDHAKAYSYYRNGNNDENGDLSTWIFERTLNDQKIDFFCYRGDGIANGQGGANVDGATPSFTDHSAVVIELNSGVDVFTSIVSSAHNITPGGAVTIDVNNDRDLKFIDQDSFTPGTFENINVVNSGDYLFGANIGAASENVASGSRYTGFSEFSMNGTGIPETFAGDYLRNNQGSTDTFGWSANLLSFVSTALDGDDMGLVTTELSTSAGGGGGAVTQSGWVGMWGLNLDTLENVNTPVDPKRNVMKVYDGSDFVQRHNNRYDGANWDAHGIESYDGSDWT